MYFSYFNAILAKQNSCECSLADDYNLLNLCYLVNKVDAGSAIKLTHKLII